MLLKELWKVLNEKFEPNQHQVQIIFRHQVQPWHPQSTQLHEISLAMEKIDTKLFWPFARLLFEKQNQYAL